MKTIRLDGVIGWDVMAADIAEKISGESSIKLVINSGGGDVTEGFSIYNLLNDFAGTVDIQVDFAASMASVIAMAGNTIAMKESSSIMMIHRPWGVSGGNSEELRKHADTLDKMEVMLLDIYEQKTGLDRAKISDMLAYETYLDAAEAKEFGFATVIESGKQDFAMVAMAGMKAKSKVDFDCSKLVAKIEQMKGSKKPVRDLFQGCETLSKVENVMRQELKLSQSEATAIVAAVRKIDHGDRDHKEVLNVISNYQFKNF